MSAACMSIMWLLNIFFCLNLQPAEGNIEYKVCRGMKLVLGMWKVSLVSYLS